MLSFRKAERLCSKKLIETLFAKGKSFTVLNLRFVYMYCNIPSNYPAQIFFTVSKKKIKKAVKRNRIKRQLREAYRLNKAMLYNYLQQHNKKMAIAIISLHTELPTYNHIVKSITEGIKRITCCDEKKNSD